jgi:hypothetical protein
VSQCHPHSPHAPAEKLASHAGAPPEAICTCPMHPANALRWGARGAASEFRCFAVMQREPREPHRQVDPYQGELCASRLRELCAGICYVISPMTCCV